MAFHRWRSGCRRSSNIIPLGGNLFCFRGKRGNLLKVIWHDGQGACLFTN
ncbi:MULTISPECIES: IS66 family insertion sequence element accessory protein TnpB [Mesorhizobium]|uniref:IS66 family insertion sequence element accessory protein TnpB n=1 Tax=Mesorhizobium calcicola TaxID=1300310 RepID=A0ABW4W975_9HYPH